jgi:hypothetical protein
MSSPALVLLLLLTTAVRAQVNGAEANGLRATILRTGQQGERAAAFASLRERKPTATAILDALTTPANLPSATVRKLVRGLLDNLPDLEPRLVEEWRREPTQRRQRGPAFLALGPERLTMLWQLEAADRADIEQVLAGGDANDHRAILRTLAGAKNPVLIPALQAIARAMAAAPHPIDALDLSLLSRCESDPALVQQQHELFMTLMAYRGDPRAMARFARLLSHTDVRVRARGSFLLRRGPAPLDVRAMQATDLGLPWDRVSVACDTATVLRVVVPAIAARGPDAVPAHWLQSNFQLPDLSLQARKTLAEALLPALQAPGLALTAAQQRQIGHLAGDQGHMRRVSFARLVIQLGAGARALHAATTTPARATVLALLDSQCATALANDADPADLRALWATGDPAVMAGVAALLASRRDALPELSAEIEAKAVAAMTGNEAAELGNASSRHLGVPDDFAPPTSAAARLTLAAGRLGCRRLFEALEQQLTDLPELLRAEDPHTTFVLRLTTELGPWLEATPAARLFDLLDKRLTAIPASDSPYLSDEAQALLAAIGGLATSLPDARLAQLELRLAGANERACIAEALPKHGPPVRRARALWLLEHWPSLARPIRLLRPAPEWLATAWHTDQAGRDVASQSLASLWAEDPQLVAEWHRKRLLPPGLLGSAAGGWRPPSLELLALVAETPSPLAWSDAWPKQVAALDPTADAAMLQRFAQAADPRFAAVAAATLVRGGRRGRDLGLPILERLAADPLPTTVAEALRSCAANGITSPTLLEIAHAHRYHQDYLASTAQALLVRAGELDVAALRKLPKHLAIQVLMLAQIGLPHEQMASLDPQLSQARIWPFMPPALQVSVLQVAEQDPVQVFQFVDDAVYASASRDPELRRAAYHLLGTIDPQVFPEATLAGEWELDSARPTGK